MRIVTWNINGLRACLRRRFNGKLVNLLNFLDAGALSCTMPLALIAPSMECLLRINLCPCSGYLLSCTIVLLCHAETWEIMHNAICQYMFAWHVQTSYVSKRPK